MTANPYVVAPKGPSATSGTFLVDDVVSLSNDIRDHNWLAAGMDTLATGLDAAATYSDPLGSAIAAGIGFILDHLEPLKGWLNDLTGDPGQVAANAGTYANVARALGTEATLLSTSVNNDLAAEQGQAIEAYRSYMGQKVQILDALSRGAGATSTALQIASSLVQVVHDLVRDAISQIVGSAISYAAELVFTLGAATPLVIEQVSTRVAEIAGRIGKSVRGVVTSVGNLKNLVKRLEEAIQGLRRLLRDAKPHPHEHPDVPTTTPVPGKLPKKGDPNSFGYDEHGDRMPYANSRPDYGPNQVDDVWEAAKDGNGEVWVRDPDGNLVKVEWEPGQPRRDVWDMGHTPGNEYNDMVRQYLNHEISKEDFLDWYRDPDNYRVEHPGRNRSHVDEAH